MGKGTTIRFLDDRRKKGHVGQDPVDGGDVILVPANMLPLGMEPVTEQEIIDEDEKAIADLMNQGYSEREAYEAIGKPYPDDEEND